ncbi:MAG: FAD binding domain-containing protein [Candidatus Adiutrix sp.]
MIDVMNFYQPARDHIDYFAPETVSEAVQKLALGNGAIISGGTDLMIDIRSGEFGGEFLVDVKNIAEMKTICEKDGHISIGAAVTIEQLRQSDLVQAKLPALALSAHNFAGLQVRNQATIGGNVGHAAPCGDTHPPIILYDGEAVLADTSGRRSVPLGDTFSGPNRTALKPNEMIVSFTLKPQKSALADFQKIGRRKDLSISRVSLAAMVDFDENGLINLAKIVLGACMPTTRRMPETENFLLGKSPTLNIFRKAAAVMAAEMIAVTGRRPSIAYKEPAIGGLFLRMMIPIMKGA